MNVELGLIVALYLLGAVVTDSLLVFGLAHIKQRWSDFEIFLAVCLWPVLALVFVLPMSFHRRALVMLDSWRKQLERWR